MQPQSGDDGVEGMGSHQGESAECCQKAASAAFQMVMGYVFIFDISLQGEGV